MIIVCLTCNITLPRRQGSRPDGTRYKLYSRSIDEVNTSLPCKHSHQLLPSDNEAINRDSTWSRSRGHIYIYIYICLSRFRNVN